MLLLYLFTLILVSLFLSSSILFSVMPNGGSDGRESACSARDPHSILREGPLEKGMATHSSILAWKIPWTEEPGRLQSMGSQKVGHD